MKKYIFTAKGTTCNNDPWEISKEITKPVASFLGFHAMINEIIINLVTEVSINDNAPYRISEFSIKEI